MFSLLVRFFLLHTKDRDGTDVWYKVNKNSFVKRFNQTKTKEAIHELKDKLNQAIKENKIQEFIAAEVKKEVVQDSAQHLAQNAVLSKEFASFKPVEVVEETSNVSEGYVPQLPSFPTTL